MRKKLKHIKTRVPHHLKKSKPGILPFMEQPSSDTVHMDAASKKLQASELFSLFTADIIREDKLFIR